VDPIRRVNTTMPESLLRKVDLYSKLNLEDRARAAGIRQLAYYHLVPVPANALAEKLFARGLSADTLLVRDLHTFDLPTGSTDIIIHAP